MYQEIYFDNDFCVTVLYSSPVLQFCTTTLYDRGKNDFIPGKLRDFPVQELLYPGLIGYAIGLKGIFFL